MSAKQKQSFLSSLPAAAVLGAALVCAPASAQPGNGAQLVEEARELTEKPVVQSRVKAHKKKSGGGCFGCVKSDDSDDESAQKPLNRKKASSSGSDDASEEESSGWGKTFVRVFSELADIGIKVLRRLAGV